MIVGIDIGTQSLKAAVTDDALGVRGEAAMAYRPNFPRPGWAEQDPRLWEHALGPTIARALAQAGVNASAGHGARHLRPARWLPRGRAREALTPCLIWMDRRAQAEIANVPAAMVRARAGLVLDASHMAAKIRWLKRHDPARCRGRPLPSAGVLYGVAPDRPRVIDHALASTSMLYGIERRGL